MVTRMPLCDRRQLQLALADRLLPDQADGLSDHLQGCPHCREELEQLAGGGQWWSEAKEYLSSTDELVAVNDMAARGCDILPAKPGDDDAAVPPLDFLAPSDQPGMLGRLGGYEIESVIGRGAFGIVLKALDPALDRRVAIKVLAGHLAASAAARKRFSYEAKAAAAVVHDHIIPIHAVDTNGLTPFLVMPLIAARSLQERLDEQGSLETREVLRIAMQTAEGLAAAHAQGLVHRDIKPANILLENGCERVRITDFGLARAVDDASQTQSGFIAGTPQYMAPEQARGEPIDSRADLFSLGSVMYAMCTGRPPFRAETTLAVLRRICDDQPRSVREVNPDVPPWLAEIIERLLTKSPADRFQSAGEVADLLRQWLAHLAQPKAILPPKFVAAKAHKPRSARAIALISVGMAAVLGLAAISIALWTSGILAGPAGPAGPARSIGVSPVPMPTSRQPVVRVPFGRRDLLGAEFAAELSRAQQQTTLLEEELHNLTPAGAAIADELAAIEQHVQALESELERITQRGTGFQPVQQTTSELSGGPESPSDIDQ